MFDRCADYFSLSSAENGRMASIEKPDLESVGGRVALLRQLKGWSQAELARHAGFAQPSVFDLENNRTREPSARLVWAVARALSVPAEYLWTGMETTPDVAMLVDAYLRLPNEQRLVVLRAAGVNLPNSKDLPPPAPLQKLN